MKIKSYDLGNNHKQLSSVGEPQVAYYSYSSSDKQGLLLSLAKSSMELLDLVSSKTNLTIKTLSETIFEITPKTFLKYKNSNTKLPSRLAEIAIEVNLLYDLGIDVFGSVAGFNGWLHAENSFFGNKNPVEFLNTSTGISLIRDVLKRIEFGATA